MGNSNEELRLNHEHIEAMELLRNTRDIKKQKILLQEKMQEFGLQKHSKEIERLMNLDNYHYQNEKRQIEAMIRKNDQFHEREKDKIYYDYQNNQKALDNQRHKIDRIFEENKIKEMNKYNYKNNELKAEFELRGNKLKGEIDDNHMKRTNEAQRDQQKYNIIRGRDEDKNQQELRKIENVRKKDSEVHEENMKKIDADSQKCENKSRRIHERRMKKLNNDLLIGQQKFNQEMAKLKNERDIEMNKTNKKHEFDIKSFVTKIQSEDSQKQRNHEEIMLDKRQNHEKELLKINAGIKQNEMQIQLQFFQIMTGLRQQNPKNQEENPEPNNNYNFNLTMNFPNFGFPFMNMMNNNNKPEN